VSFDCRHLCCDIRDCHHHRHTLDPGHCVLCIQILHDRPWTYTEDPREPCIWCVQWRCVDEELGLYEPYLPDGSVVPLVYNGVCDSCQLALDRMEIERDRT
jgi:hypothetical protein